MSLHLLQFLALFLFTLVAQNATAADDWLEKGERLHFDVSFGILKAGEAEILYKPHKTTNQNSYQIISRAWTTGLGAALFSLRDRVSVVGSHNPHPFYSKQYTMELNENDYRAHKTVDYHRYNHEAVYTNIQGNEKPKSFVMRSDARDMMSALYHLRNSVGEVKGGDEIVIPIVDLDKTYLMHIKLGEKTPMETALGKRDVRKLDIAFQEITKNEPPVPSAWKFWVTADEDRYPVKIAVELKFGSFTANLQKVGNRSMESRAPKNLPEEGKILMSKTEKKKTLTYGEPSDK